MQSRVLLPFMIMFLVVSPLFAQNGDSKAGKAVFAKRCAACHGPNGEGNPKIADMLKVNLRHLGSKEVQAQSDAQIQKIIREGQGKMKPVKNLTDAEAAGIIAYIRTLAHN